MHFTEGKRARDKECDKESDAADDAAKTKDGFGRKVHSFGVVEVWCWSRSSERLLIVDDTQIGRGGGGACTTFHDGNWRCELSSYYNAQTHGEQLNLLQARMQGMKVKDDSKHLDVLAIIVCIHQVHLL